MAKSKYTDSKVKIFRSQNPEELEVMINDFTQTGVTVIDIKYSSSSFYDSITRCELIEYSSLIIYRAC